MLHLVTSLVHYKLNYISLCIQVPGGNSLCALYIYLLVQVCVCCVLFPPHGYWDCQLVASSEAVIVLMLFYLTVVSLFNTSM